MNRAFSADGFWADEPRALPWAGMNDALGVSAPPHCPTTLTRSSPSKHPAPPGLYQGMRLVPTGIQVQKKKGDSKEPPLPKPTTMKQEPGLHSKQPTPCSTMKYRIEIDGTDARDIQYITFCARGCAHFSGARTFLSAGGLSG